MLHLNSTHINHGFFFFNDTATTEIYTLSLHDALPISLIQAPLGLADPAEVRRRRAQQQLPAPGRPVPRSEEHTSELQSRLHLVCRLLLEKKNDGHTSRGRDEAAAVTQSPAH